MNLKTYLSEARGRASALARAIGVSPVTVHQWAGGKQVPAERCPQIEEWSGGNVTCESLRPDLLDRWIVLRKPLVSVGEKSPCVSTETSQQEVA